MTKKLLLTSAAVLTAAAVGWWLVSDASHAEATPYEFARVERGKVEVLVSATGTLNAVETVEVGTQVSGTIAQVLADYNDQVREGQLLAMIDTDLLDAGVLEAKASVARAEAELARARSELARLEPLYSEGFVSDQEFRAQQTVLQTADANALSAQASLDRATKSRSNAEIRSPVDGVVIERAVERGQTVAASLSTPTLFLLAEDLTRMEILTDVDESDIGQVRDGQPVRFTVATYPDELFSGVVQETRLQPQVISNVVTYTVVVEADNERGLLLPGMTATVDFIVSEAEQALVVSSAALRVEPTAEMVDEIRARRQAETAPAAGPNVPGTEAGSGRFADMSRLWYLDADDQLQIALVDTGVSDGLKTEIIPLRGPVEEGMQVISRAIGEAIDLADAPQGPLGGMRGRRMGI